MLSSGSGAKKKKKMAAAPAAAEAQQQQPQQQPQEAAVEALARTEAALAGVQTHIDGLASMLASTPNAELERLYAQAFVAASKNVAALTAEKRLHELVRDGADKAVIAAQRSVADAARAAAAATPPQQYPTDAEPVRQFPLWRAAWRHFHGGGAAQLMDVDPGALATVGALLAPLQAHADDKVRKTRVVRPLGCGDVDDEDAPVMPKRTHARNEDVRTLVLPRGMRVACFDNFYLLKNKVLLLRPTVLTALEPIALALLTAARKPLGDDEDEDEDEGDDEDEDEDEGDDDDDEDEDKDEGKDEDEDEDEDEDGGKDEDEDEDEDEEDGASSLTANERAVFRLFFPNHLRDYSALLPAKDVERITRDGAFTDEDVRAMDDAVVALSKGVLESRIAVLTGTSGIGKSTSINYLLLLFAALRRPIALYHGRTYSYMNPSTGAVVVMGSAPANCHVLYDVVQDGDSDVDEFTLPNKVDGLRVAFMSPTPLFSSKFRKRFPDIHVAPVHEWSVAELPALAPHIRRSMREGLSNKAVVTELRKRHVWLGGNLRELLCKPFTTTGVDENVGLARVKEAFAELMSLDVSQTISDAKLADKLKGGLFTHLAPPPPGRAFGPVVSPKAVKELLVPVSLMMVWVVTSMPRKPSESAAILNALLLVVSLLGMRSVKGLAYEELFLTWASHRSRAEKKLTILPSSRNEVQLTLPAGDKLEIVYAASDVKKDAETRVGLETVSAALKRPLKAGTDGRLVVPVVRSFATYDFLLVLRNAPHQRREWGLQLKSGSDGPFADLFGDDPAARADAFAAAQHAAERSSEHQAWRLASRAGLSDAIPVTFVRPDDDKTRPLIVIPDAVLADLPPGDAGGATRLTQLAVLDAMWMEDDKQELAAAAAAAAAADPNKDDDAAECID